MNVFLLDLEFCTSFILLYKYGLKQLIVVFIGNAKRVFFCIVFNFASVQIFASFDNNQIRYSKDNWVKPSEVNFAFI